MTEQIRDESALQARINLGVNRYVRMFGMDWAEVTNRFWSVLPDGDGDDDHETVCIAKCENWHYRRFTLRWNLTCLAGVPDKDIDSYIIHELVHCLMACYVEDVPASYANKNAKLLEMATENIALALQGAMFSRDPLLPSSKV